MKVRRSDWERVLPQHPTHFIHLIHHALAARDSHKGCREEGNKLFLSGVLGEYLSLRYGKRLTGLHDARTRKHPIPGGWGQKIYLKLGGKHADARRHTAERGITGSIISNSCQRSPMYKAMLLRYRRRRGQHDFYRTRRNPREVRADGLHKTLLGETRSD